MRSSRHETQSIREPTLGERTLRGSSWSDAAQRHFTDRLDVIWVLVALVLIVSGTVWWTAIVEMDARERSEIESVKRESANLAMSFEEHTVRTLDAVGQVARMAASEYRAEQAGFDLDRFVATVHLPAELIFGLFIADQDGNIVRATQGGPRGNVGDRTYFQAHRTVSGGRSHVGRTVFSPLSQRWVMPVSLRIDHPDGSFGGVIVVGLNPFYFSDFYKRIDLGTHGVVTLAGMDGYIRTRLSAGEAGLGNDVRNAPIFAAIRREPNGSIVFASVIDGTTRIYSYRTLKDYPIFVAVGRSQAEVLAPIRSARSASYFRATVATLLIGFVTGWLALALQRQQRAKRSLRESEERLRVFADNMEEIFWLATPALERMLYLSPAFERVLGHSAAELKRDSSLWRAWIHPDHRLAAEAFLERQMKGERTEVELRVMRADGDFRWLLVRSVPWRSSDGTALVAGIAADVTSRKRAEEERIALAERQRDTLIMEVHHRIKNNLQGVLGLLAEHARRRPESRGVLDVVAARVHSVATVYGLQGHRAGAVVLLDDLVASIAETLQRMTDARITFCPPGRARIVQITDRETVPLALVLNELIWNALKHSSDTPKQATIMVESEEEKQVARVEVCNAALSPAENDFSSDRTTGMGLGLVKALLPPRGARLEFAYEAGQVKATLTLSDPVVVWCSPSEPAGGERSISCGRCAAAPPG